MKQLLQRKPAYRLGQGASGPSAIKKHPWFNGFDWDAFVAKKLKAPYMPVVRRTACTLCNVLRPAWDFLGSWFRRPILSMRHRFGRQERCVEWALLSMC